MQVFCGWNGLSEMHPMLQVPGAEVLPKKLDVRVARHSFCCPWRIFVLMSWDPHSVSVGRRHSLFVGQGGRSRVLCLNYMKLGANTCCLCGTETQFVFVGQRRDLFIWVRDPIWLRDTICRFVSHWNGNGFVPFIYGGRTLMHCRESSSNRKCPMEEKIRNLCMGPVNYPGILWRWMLHYMLLFSWLGMTKPMARSKSPEALKKHRKPFQRT